MPRKSPEVQILIAVHRGVAQQSVSPDLHGDVSLDFEIHRNEIAYHGQLGQDLLDAEGIAVVKEFPIHVVELNDLASDFKIVKDEPVELIVGAWWIHDCSPKLFFNFSSSRRCFLSGLSSGWGEKRALSLLASALRCLFSMLSAVSS